MQENITFAITMARNYGGKIFGDYVRQVIIPSLKNEPAEQCKIVNFWFSNEDDCTQYILRMGTKLQKIQSRFNLCLLEGTTSDEELICNFIVSDTPPEGLTYDGEFPEA
jgi:hypothetical protein